MSEAVGRIRYQSRCWSTDSLRQMLGRFYQSQFCSRSLQDENFSSFQRLANLIACTVATVQFTISPTGATMRKAEVWSKNSDFERENWTIRIFVWCFTATFSWRFCCKENTQTYFGRQIFARKKKRKRKTDLDLTRQESCCAIYFCRIFVVFRSSLKV